MDVIAPQTLQAILEKGRVDIENVGRLYPDALHFTDGNELSVKEVLLDMDFVPEPKKK